MDAVVPATEALTFELERFIYHEGNLLDDRRYEEWLELLADDVTYWLPNFSENAPPGESGVIVLERLPALQARVARALDPENPTQMPSARTRRRYGSKRQRKRRGHVELVDLCVEGPPAAALSRQMRTHAAPSRRPLAYRCEDDQPDR